MKKIYFLILANLLFIEKIYANTPKITIKGILDLQLANISQTHIYKDPYGAENFRFKNLANFEITIESVTNHNSAYGIKTNFVPIKNRRLHHSSRNTNILEKSHVFFENNYGHIEIGNNYSASEMMKIGAENIAAATGGIAGDYSKHVNLNLPTIDQNNMKVNLIINNKIDPVQKYETFILEPNILSDYVSEVISGGQKSDKITYMSPKFRGLQFGVSYNFSKKLKNKGNNINYGIETGYMKQALNEISAGLNFSKQLKNYVIVNIGLTGDYTPQNKLKIYDNIIERKKLKSFNMGVELEYIGFKLAGSYGNWYNSLDIKHNPNSPAKISKYYTIGGAYYQGPFRMSLTHFRSNFNQNKFESLAFGADYLVKSGVSLYGEIVSSKQRPYNITNNTKTPNNKATIFLTGVEFRF